MSSDHGLPPFLVEYMLKRDAQRLDAVNDLLGKLTAREQRLVREAAVMGYVRGSMHPKDEKIPKDSSILTEVVDACLAAPDLYPVMHAISELTEEGS